MSTEQLNALLAQVHLEIGRRMNAAISRGDGDTYYGPALDSIRETRALVTKAEMQAVERIVQRR